ncbi:helix-turn-helix transcriptional regulator [Sphingobium boeckii]|uniref:DNA-binding CsgD family transcriptional regulator n=1 Tax=Sphingobium boeckii TaxID=1082345 RepID=A0A7W9ALE1_9SPHN|nr:helix-turn-helix transcriptional regulator [Sphingobium boeckii]MBB5687818.1 DNA-binding CsgD family transcriptional regulator [Sphingobium boeckii]
MIERDMELSLICALIDGGLESPKWTTFFALLQRATGAEHVMLTIRIPGRPYEEVITLPSGDLEEKVQATYRQYFHPHDGMVDTAMIEGRPYSLDEMLGQPVTPNQQAHRNVVELNGITAARMVRIEETTGVNAWLILVGYGDDFTSDLDGLLITVARVLKGVLRQYVALERERFEASLTGEAARRLQFGWLTLDRAGTVLDCDSRAAQVLAQSGVLSRSTTGRLTCSTPELEREIREALSHVVANAASRPRAITLSRNPWLDMLLVPADRKSISTKAKPAAIAYVHGDSWSSVQCRDQLAELFRLLPREAEIALALCRGMTIAEVASDLGLTVGTTRNYSKSIYAKTGARGLPDLVRLVMRSVLAIGPSSI